MDSLDYYDKYMLRSSEELRIKRKKLIEGLAAIHNLSGAHHERIELRERITVIGVILAERELF